MTSWRPSCAGPARMPSPQPASSSWIHCGIGAQQSLRLVQLPFLHQLPDAIAVRRLRSRPPCAAEQLRQLGVLAPPATWACRSTRPSRSGRRRAPAAGARSRAARSFTAIQSDSPRGAPSSGRFGSAPCSSSSRVMRDVATAHGRREHAVMAGVLEVGEGAVAGERVAHELLVATQRSDEDRVPRAVETAATPRSPRARPASTWKNQFGISAQCTGRYPSPRTASTFAPAASSAERRAGARSSPRGGARCRPFRCWRARAPDRAQARPRPPARSPRAAAAMMACVPDATANRRDSRLRSSSAIVARGRDPRRTSAAIPGTDSCGTPDPHRGPGETRRCRDDLRAPRSGSAACSCTRRSRARECAPRVASPSRCRHHAPRRTWRRHRRSQRPFHRRASSADPAKAPRAE